MVKTVLSIIIPVYNTEKYLKDCISSALDVDVKTKEIIIINDGSVDGSEKIILDFKKKYDCIKYISQKNKGPGGARNAALNIAKGEYIFCLDSDDTIKKGSLEKILSIAQRDNADVIHFNVVYHSHNVPGFKKYEKQHNLTWYYTAVFDDAPIKKTQCLLMNQKNIFFKTPVWWYLFRRDLIENNCLRFEENLIHEDDLFTTIALMNAKKIKFVPIIVYDRKFRPNSIMIALDPKKSISCLRIVCDKLYAYYLSSNLDSEENKYLERYIFNQYVRMINIASSLKQGRSQYLNMIYSDISKKREIHDKFGNKIFLFLKCRFSKLFN